MPKFKSKNIVDALQKRQYAGTSKFIDNILLKRAEDIIMAKTYLIDFSAYKFNLNRNVRTTFLTVFSPDGERVACAHGDRTISIISMKTNKIERVLSSGHIRSIWTLSWAPFLKGSSYIIATGCLGGHVKLWFNDKRSSVAYDFKKPIASLSFHPILPILAVAVDNTLVFWDVRNNERPQVTLAFGRIETNNKIRYVHYDNVGKYLITGVRQPYTSGLHSNFLAPRVYALEVWGLNDEGVLKSLNRDNCRLIVATSLLHNDSTVVIDANFTKIATSVKAHDGDSVNIYSLKPDDFGVLLQCICIPDVIVSLSFSPSLRHLIIGHNTIRDTSVMSVVSMESTNGICDQYVKSEIILYQLVIKEIRKIESITGAINECIRDYLHKEASFICVCSNKREEVINDTSKCKITCDWFINYIQTIDDALFCFNILTIHDLKFKALLEKMRNKYKLCHELTNEVLVDIHNFCLEVQKCLKYNTMLCRDQPLLKLNCLCWSNSIENGIIASFNNGDVILYK